MFGNSNAEKPPVAIEFQALPRVENKHNDQDSTSLMLAAKKGRIAMMMELLKRKPELLEARDSEGNTALIYAAFYGQEAAVKQLLEAKADINTRNNNGTTPLMAAAEEGHVAILAELLNRKPEPLLEARDSYGDTALMVAAFYGQEAAVNQLLEAKADINTCDNYDLTPLMRAAEKGHIAVMVELLRRKPELLEARGSLNGHTVLMCAVIAGQEAVVSQLLEAKADINTRNNNGVTPLMAVAEEGHVAILAELLKRRPELLEARDSDGNTALMWAAFWGQEAAMRRLLEAKADINIRDNAGMTPLMAAAQKDHVAILAELLTRRPELLLETRDSAGDTALTVAAFCGQKAAVKQLLEANAEVNVKDNEGETTFTRAVKPLVSHCLKKDAKLETKEDKVNSDKVSNYWQILKLLIERDVNTITTSPLTEQVASATIINETGQRISLAVAVQAERDKYTYAAKTAFAMGFHPRLGADSSLHTLAAATNKTLDRKLVCLINDFAGFSYNLLKESEIVAAMDGDDSKQDNAAKQCKL